ncbi:MAG: type III pantothenate kinase, partial [Sphingobacteriales bacterium]
MTCLVIDIGNTLTKLGVFEQDKLLHTAHFANVDEALLLNIITAHKISKAIISSVKKTVPEWYATISTKIPVINFRADMAKSITNNYLTPATLGIDRIAAVAGAQALCPGKSSLVIDGGTTITYDHVDENGNFFGGSISPGLNTRYKALNHYTEGLPLIEADKNFSDPYGNNTTTAIQSGVQNGLK